ncbi:hypothetical protein [Paenibacillus tengchongensis]|uniref:hypothetical protein n=1 Tax=Paenibacillus tengchongensis TaxID=2608684 RepID=UPI00124DC069|nr:hypothetical protein [Paenibacillus tengchongensis]
MTTIINYGSTVISPIPPGGGGLPIIGGAELATTSVYIDPANPASYSNRVEIKGSIGLFVVTGGINASPQIKVRILRAGTEIYSAIFLLKVLSDTQVLNVLTVDGAPLGVQNYQLAVENIDPTRNSSFVVTGPIVFTAVAYGG